MFKKLKAFSLVEILVAMALVGVLVTILSPNLGKLLPDKKKALFIKAYTRTEIAVANMRNHPEMYVDTFDPEAWLASDESKSTYKTFGLCNTEKPGGYIGDTDPAEGDAKFVHYFARELGAENNESCIKTSDGAIYYVVFENAGSTSPNVNAATITVKAINNGKEGKPEETVGIISVQNDGDVSCSSDTPEDGDGGENKCQEYLQDRFELKQDLDKWDEEPAS